MDWQRRIWALLSAALLLPYVSCWSTIDDADAANAVINSRRPNSVSPYIDMVLCPIREQPWSCARSQSARILDVWDEELHAQWHTLKVEADRQLNATLQKRGYSASEVITKEKPSSILKKIEIGTNFMKEYLAETMDGFLGREYEYMESNKDDAAREDEEEDGTDSDDGEADGEDHENGDEEDEPDEEIHDPNNDNGIVSHHPVRNTNSAVHGEDIANDGEEFIDIGESSPASQLRRPGGEGKKKKKKGQAGQPATVLLVQPVETHTSDVHSGGSSFDSGHGSGGKPLKQKRKKRKKHQHGGGESVVVVEEEPHHHLGLGLLEELVDTEDLFSSGGGKRKHKHPSKYGRSNGVTRGKKKKKKKALMKLVLLGSFLKAKIELLLKILGAHLQIKFFAIALIGLLINIARFWIDVKRGGAPQKVVYVEHAHHQHHYEDHGEDWGEQGGYWKRSLQTDHPTAEEGGFTDSYQLRPQQDAHYLAYRNQWQ